MSDARSPPPPPMRPRRLLDRVRDATRIRHMSPRTEKAYVGWTRRFVLFHGTRHPDEMRGPEVVAFLSDLAVHRGVGPVTQNQALSALLFLYREVLGRKLEGLDEVVRARSSRALPVVLSRDEVRRVLSRLDGTHRLVTTLLYGSGLRLLEALRLRVKDVDFERRQVTVRQGKGRRDRRCPLSLRLREPLERHLARIRSLHEHDCARGIGVRLPGALHRKYPSARSEWGWYIPIPGLLPRFRE